MTQYNQYNKLVTHYLEKKQYLTVDWLNIVPIAVSNWYICIYNIYIYVETYIYIYNIHV